MYKDLVEFNIKKWDGKPFGAICYDQVKGDRDVEPGIKVRKWGSKEWLEPNADLLEGW